MIDKYLPGKYTIITIKKQKDFLNHISPTEKIGIRIPKIELTKLIQKSEKPFVTTSVNLSGEKPIEKIGEINPKILKKVDLIIDAGKISGSPSTIIDGNEIIRR